MELQQAIAIIYPDLVLYDPILSPHGVYTVVDFADGAGPQIGMWNTNLPKPTPQQLAAAYEELRLRAERDKTERDALALLVQGIRGAGQGAPSRQEFENLKKVIVAIINRHGL